MVVEKTFQEVISTINDGEIWVNKYKNKRLTKIQKLYDSIIFDFDDEYKDIGVGLNDIFIMERKEYDTGYAMQELLKGKEIESCISEFRFKFIDNDINYFNKDYSRWKVVEYPFSTREITNNWYINN
jgi:hypothetical protein